MDNEDIILDEMENTRAAFTEKLETLEQRVGSTVESATANVAEAVEAVQETVATVTDTIQETVAAVKETVHESVGAVKDMFDIPGHVACHPWLMMAGAVGLGFLLGEYLTEHPMPVSTGGKPKDAAAEPL